MFRSIYVGEPDIEATESSHVRHQTIPVRDANNVAGKRIAREPPGPAVLSARGSAMRAAGNQGEDNQCPDHPWQ